MDVFSMESSPRLYNKSEAVSEEDKTFSLGPACGHFVQAPGKKMKLNMKCNNIILSLDAHQTSPHKNKI
jgi:hypothetical protein